MFDIGFWELLLVAVIGLLVVGPDRLPSMARETGVWIRYLRSMVRNARQDLEHELIGDDEDTDYSVSGLKRRLRSVERELTGDDEDNANGVSDIKHRLREMDRMMKEVPNREFGYGVKSPSPASSISEQDRYKQENRNNKNDHDTH